MLENVTGRYRMLENVPNVAFDSCFNDPVIYRQLTDLYFKWKKSIKMMLLLLAIREMILRAVLPFSVETHSSPSQGLNVNGFN